MARAQRHLIDVIGLEHVGDVEASAAACDAAVVQIDQVQNVARLRRCCRVGHDLAVHVAELELQILGQFPASLGLERVEGRVGVIGEDVANLLHSGLGKKLMGPFVPVC